MDFLISAAHAQAAPGAQQPRYVAAIMMVLFFAIFWFIAIRPQMKRAKEHRAMLGALAKGDEVAVAGGPLATDDIGESVIIRGTRARPDGQGAEARHRSGPAQGHRLSA